MSDNRQTTKFSIDFQDTIKANQKDAVVLKVQNYLLDYGYMKADFTPALLDDLTQNALRAFQRRRRIATTGEIDLVTALEIEAPRCGAADFHLDILEAPAGFAVFRTGCSFAGETELKYAFSNYDAGAFLDAALIEGEVKKAFRTWKGQIGIDFKKIDATADATLVLGWFREVHDIGGTVCTKRFNGREGDVGHSFPKKGCAALDKLASQCHFDADERWRTFATANDIDLQTVALHEIGHLLGLPHSDNENAVMYEVYPREGRRELHPSDETEIRRLYHIHFLDLEIIIHFEGIEDRKFRDKEFTETADGQRRPKGFRIRFCEPAQGVSMRYRARIDDADSDFAGEGEFLGTRDPAQAGEISAFAIELIGPQADKYNVFYRAKIQDVGVTPVSSNGSFCGHGYQSKPIDSLQVWVELKT